MHPRLSSNPAETGTSSVVHFPITTLAAMAVAVLALVAVPWLAGPVLAMSALAACLVEAARARLGRVQATAVQRRRDGGTFLGGGRTEHVVSTMAPRYVDGGGAPASKFGQVRSPAADEVTYVA